MRLEYNLKKLEDALYDFHRVSGISITYYSTDFQPLRQKSTQPARYCSMIATCAEGAAGCHHSTTSLLHLCSEKREPVRHICAAGLVDIAVPLIHAGNTLGFLMMGQIRFQEDFPAVAENLELDRSELEARYRELPCHDEETISAIMHTAIMLTKYILLENMIRPKTNSSAEAVAAFIDAHLMEKLTVQRIVRHVHLSQSGVYKCIRTCYGCTLGEYINRRRIERSLPLLENGEYSIEKIAMVVGFSSTAYYSRCFKKMKGCSPLHYRQKHQSKN